VYVYVRKSAWELSWCFTM